MLRTFGLVLAAAVLLGPHVASAQPIGTFRWQLTPYCNVVALDVIQEGSVFRLQGTDDECGQSGGRPAVVTGIGLLDPSGFVRMGLTTIPPDGAVTEGALVTASISLINFSGGWRDNAGQSGSFVFTPGAGTLGPRRGLVPSTFVHVVTTANRVAMGRPDNATCFSHPLTDGNPDALIFFTRNLGRASQGRPVVPGPVSLVYQDIPSNVPRFDNVWCLRRTNDLDNPAIPLGTAFTIRVALR